MDRPVGLALGSASQASLSVKKPDAAWPPCPASRALLRLLHSHHIKGIAACQGGLWALPASEKGNSRHVESGACPKPDPTVYAVEAPA